MQHKKLIQQEIDFTKSFSLIVEAYQEIAVMKMRRVRNSVLATRDYLSRLSEVFLELKRAKEMQKKQLLEKKVKRTTKEQGTDKKLDRTVSVLLSANTTLYGDLLERIFQLFLKDIKKGETDLIIVGRVGKRLYDEQDHKRPYLYFELPDVEITLESLKPVIFHLVKYEKIMVYYGKFESVVTQVETVSNITGDEPFITRTELQEVPKALIKYLFEPDLDALLAFFEDLIASSLFRQTVHETQLARWASRIMSMEKAQVGIETQMKKLRLSSLKIQKQEQNKSQLERLAGISLWRS